MNTPFSIKTILGLLLALAICRAAFSEPLVPQQGQYWKWSAPLGWHHSESIAGVTLTSPDGRYSAALAGLMRSQGYTTPQVFMGRMLGLAYKNVRIGSVRPLPSQQMGYQTWNWIEAEVTATGVGGTPMKGLWKCGVANYYNLNDALVVGYWSPLSDFQQSKAWLAPIAESIIMTNPSQAFGNDQLIHPKNNPNTTGDAIMQSWENKNQSQDRSMQNWSRAMRGNEPTFDPETGTRYSTPLNSWDATKGGYVNPNRPTELLQCGTPEDPHPCAR